MSDLRKAAAAVLEAWGWDVSEPRNKMLRERMESLRQALTKQDTTLKFYTGGKLVGSVDFPGAVEKQEHEFWCASLTQVLACNPPKPAPCNCKLKDRNT